MSVVDLPVITRLAGQPDRVLTKALGEGLSEAVVIGRDADGCFYFASSIADGADVVWLMESAKWRLLQIAGALGSDE